MTHFLSDKTEEEIWLIAKDNNVILIPFKMPHSFVCAAINTQTLEEVCRQRGLDSNNWDDIFSLDLNFYINNSIPAQARTLKEAYIKVLNLLEANEFKLDDVSQY